MALVSTEARELALRAVEMEFEPESRPLTTRIRTDVNDPSVQLLLAEIAVRLGRIEELLSSVGSVEKSHPRRERPRHKHGAHRN